MAEPQPPLKKLSLAVGGMTCVNCEILVERRFKEIPGVQRVNVSHTRGYAELDHVGDLDIATLQHAVKEDGYTVSHWTEGATARGKNSARDYAEIAGIFAV